jgi:cyclopropane-fatty-acyl-phospholipid synthase
MTATEIPVQRAQPADPRVEAARTVATDLFGPPRERTFAIRYWDGTTESPPGDASFALDVRHASAFRRMLLPPTELSIVEAFLFGDIDIVGDLEAAADLGDVVAKRIARKGAPLRLFKHLLALPRSDDRQPRESSSVAHVARRLFRFGRRHSTDRDAHAVRFHYDVGNDFYRLWLDGDMVYSCAYFEHGDESLDVAQTKKLDLVCRKLRLRRGERLLDIGSGWGALVIHAAKHYGVSATGITLSEQQATLARERIAREGLSDRVTIDVRDYRTLDDSARFDKIASVGMVEHVGLRRLPDYFAAAYHVLVPGGLFLNHGIVSLSGARPRPVLDPLWRRLWQRDQFIRRYVFPDGDLVPSAAVIASAEAEGFETRDVESLREHYVKTLRDWVHRLEQHADGARAIVGDVTYRVWRLYMGASAYGFRTARIGVIQTLFAKPDAEGSVGLPRSRADLFLSNNQSKRADDADQRR